jgi:NTE family protein
MKSRRLVFFAVLLSFITGSNLSAQAGAGGSPEQTPANIQRRPRIALVLEGGGALGLAHLGVIRWLEENRIPVDMIAGTSMGGLVGGIYASGESPEQISKLIRDIRWNEVLRGATPYTDLFVSPERGPARISECI